VRAAKQRLALFFAYNNCRRVRTTMIAREPSISAPGAFPFLR
jgi:hypothetical protein